MLNNITYYVSWTETNINILAHTKVIISIAWYTVKIEDLFCKTVSKIDIFMTKVGF